MLVLFSIAMLCFFALFAMILALMYQAKREGANEQRDESRARALAEPQSLRAERRSLRSGLGLTLSNLVPTKQPDWRFMVRGGGYGRRPVQRAMEVAPVGARPQALRSDRMYFNQDLGDVSDPQAPRTGFARRA